MRKYLAVAAMCAAAFTAAACSGEVVQREETGGGVVESQEPPADDANGQETAGDVGDLGGCGGALATDAVGDILAAAGTDVVEDYSGPDYLLGCTWTTGDDAGPEVILGVEELPGADMNADLLESLGQTVIDDARFSDLGLVPTVVLGCENGHAGDMLGCSLYVYGQGIDLALQVLWAENVTQDEMVEALWVLTEAVYA